MLVNQASFDCFPLGHEQWLMESNAWSSLSLHLTTIQHAPEKLDRRCGILSALFVTWSCEEAMVPAFGSRHSRRLDDARGHCTGQD